jgi:hypothetical protein
VPAAGDRAASLEHTLGFLAQSVTE